MRRTQRMPGRGVASAAAVETSETSATCSAGDRAQTTCSPRRRRGPSRSRRCTVGDASAPGARALPSTAQQERSAISNPRSRTPDVRPLRRLGALVTGPDGPSFEVVRFDAAGRIPSSRDARDADRRSRRARVRRAARASPRDCRYSTTSSASSPATARLRLALEVAPGQRRRGGRRRRPGARRGARRPRPRPRRVGPRLGAGCRPTRRSQAPRSRSPTGRSSPRTSTSRASASAGSRATSSRASSTSSRPAPGLNIHIRVLEGRIRARARWRSSRRSAPRSARRAAGGDAR